MYLLYTSAYFWGAKMNMNHELLVKSVVLVSYVIQHELDTVQQVKEEIEELREYVDRLEEHSHRRKLRLLQQVRECMESIILSSFIITIIIIYIFILLYIFFSNIIRMNKAKRKASKHCYIYF